MGTPPENAGGQGDGADGAALDLSRRSDRVLLGRAARRRWPVTTKRKFRYLAALDKAIIKADEEGDARTVVGCAKVLAAMEKQNQADDHLAHETKRLDEGKPTVNVGRAVPTLEDAVARLLAQSIPLEAWPPMVRAFHSKKVEAKAIP